ncbi:MAG: AraC family transcriptional regulator [Myxococcota bacterium]
MEDIAWQTVARVLHRVQSDLDAPWDLDRMAHVAGYERHHLAHLFRDVVGEPPARYVRRLRLERAAGDLLTGVSVAQTAERAVYGSAEAFSRAFKRQFGVAPVGFSRHVREEDLSAGPHPDLHGATDAEEGPPGLDTEARVEAIGPVYGWTVIVPSFEPPHLGYGMAQLLGACPPDRPWQLGGIAQPWGWLTDEAPREFRCLRVRDRDDRAPPPPLVPWSWPRDWFAVFDYDGPLDQIEAACSWMASRWPERVGVRLGYGPLFSLLEAMTDPSRARARLHLAVRPLAAG